MNRNYLKELLFVEVPATLDSKLTDVVNSVYESKGLDELCKQDADGSRCHKQAEERRPEVLYRGRRHQS